MLEMLVRNMLADLGMTPEQLQDFLRNATAQISESAERMERMENQLARIEKMLADTRANKRSDAA